ncbi:MAG: phosphoribosylformylglycinamidine cyclo-ligase [Phycisphaerae bacterium]
MAKSTDKQSMTYKDSGVDIEAGEQMVQKIRPMVESTFGPRVMQQYGGFAGLFRLDYNEKLFKKNYSEPVLIGCTDGVGTKTKVALMLNRLDTVGIDCVAMNVNDLICCGGEPLFFLDYIGTGKLGPERMAELVKGVSEGCIQAGAALLGGETAEMPDVYTGEDFDLAGFAVGVVERDRIIDGSNVEPGDAVIALASDGLHSNGYGLARKVLFDRAGYSPDDAPPELLGASVGQTLLTPTRIYVRPVLQALGAYTVKKVVKSLAHITGGGLPGNLVRNFPDGLTVRIKADSWPIPPIFKLIAKKGPVDDVEMTRTFNMGVGFCMVVAPAFASAIMNRLRRMGERCWLLGKVVKGGPELRWT